MLKDLNYVAFDFETTWLNVEIHDAIQIWIVKFNKKFEIVEEFSCYVKPDNFEWLSEIVEFTTWIKTSQIENAPRIEDVKKKLVSFFDENTILIWHNIQFDINFMEKYLWKIPYYWIFDTYEYSRLFLHFQVSYALEIIADNFWFKRNSHDAFEDSLMSLDLFKLLVKKISKIIKKYPFLQDVILKSDSDLQKILQLENTNQKIYSIPKSSVSIPKSKIISSISKRLEDFPNKTVFNTLWVNFTDSLNFAVNGQRKVILAFSSRNRLNMARSFLKQKYISYSYLTSWNIANAENEKNFLSKSNFKDYESNYLLKAFSHYLDEISIFDITNFQEYKVNKFLSWRKRNLNWNFVLTTHYELFSFIKDFWNKQLQDYKIIFFDWHLWMNSLWNVFNKWFDFYELLNKLEVLQYQKQFEQDVENIEKLINEVSAFFGGLSVKLKSLFKWTKNKIEMVDVFSDTRNWLNQMKNWFLELDKKLKFLEDDEITNYWNLFKDCVENYCILEQKLFANWNLKYIFNPLMENVDINVFNDYMKNLTHYNFTIMNKKDYVKLDSIIQNKNKNNVKIVDYKDDIDFKQLVETIKQKMKESKKIFLVSNNKNFSNSLFKLIFNLCKENNINVNIYAENITWWQWKLLYYLSKDYNRKIVIWWPEFLIWNQSKFIKYDEIYLISINWKNRNYIIEDIKNYIN